MPTNVLQSCTKPGLVSGCGTTTPAAHASRPLGLSTGVEHTVYVQPCQVAQVRSICGQGADCVGLAARRRFGSHRVTRLPACSTSQVTPSANRWRLHLPRTPRLRRRESPSRQETRRPARWAHLGRLDHCARPPAALCHRAARRTARSPLHPPQRRPVLFRRETKREAPSSRLSCGCC